MRDGHPTHGDTKGAKITPEYQAWANMISRCTNLNRPDYKHYGGRGIAVCERWLHDYAAFLADMGRRPSPSHSIERRNNSEGYGKDNCIWATRTDQARNRRSTKRITAFGRSLTAREWSEETGINVGTIKSRLRLGMSPEVTLKRHIQTKEERAALVSKLAVVRWSRRAA